jgi:hypothetical protein
VSNIFVTSINKPVFGHTNHFLQLFSAVSAPLLVEAVWLNLLLCINYAS